MLSYQKYLSSLKIDQVLELKDEVLKIAFRFENEDISFRLFEWLMFQQMEVELEKYMSNIHFGKYVEQRKYKLDPLQISEVKIML